MMTVFSLWVNGFDMMMCSGSQDISRFPRRFVWAVVHVTRGPAAQWPALLVPSGAPQEMLLRAQHTSPQPERWRDTIWMYFLSIITDNIRALSHEPCLSIQWCSPPWRPCRRRTSSICWRPLRVVDWMTSEQNSRMFPLPPHLCCPKPNRGRAAGRSQRSPGPFPRKHPKRTFTTWSSTHRWALLHTHMT